MSPPVEIARALMADFARRTVVPGAGAPRRSLWTDAFAVCNLLELHRVTGEAEHLATALRLVDEVHETLGEAFDERLEWERDGQYFHYLTKWMHALARVARATGDRARLLQAIELARAAHAGFTVALPGGGKRLLGKTSIDLSRPLLDSMGQHDPLDGMITFRALRWAAIRASEPQQGASLDAAIGDMREMCEGARWATGDALGIGGLLADAHRLAELARARDDGGDARLLAELVGGAALGLATLAHGRAFEAPIARRVAFRELGLAIGLHAVQRLVPIARDLDVAHLDGLVAFVPLAAVLEKFWLDPAHQATDAWRDQLDMNSVMLATSLVPDGFLGA